MPKQKISFDFPEPVDLSAQLELPDPRVRLDGSRIQSPQEWLEQRVYLKALLAHYQYGHMPPKPHALYIQKTRTERILADQAQCTWLKVHIERNQKHLDLHLNVVLPLGDGPFPVIIKNDRYLLLTPIGEIPNPRPSTIRTIQTDHDILPKIIARGYGLCKFQRTDLARDQHHNRDSGVFPMYPEYDWGTIAAWAWGYQLVIDALTTMPQVDAQRLAATGHSRGGKTALCAAIYDERIAIAAPNSSGTGGTGSLRIFEASCEPHQTLARHIGRHDYWWGPRFLDFANHEERLPFDAHTAKVLIAPRGLVNAHARQDTWANPYGTQVTHDAAKEIFAWLGAEDHIALHWREGTHAQAEADWLALLDFADAYFWGKPIPWSQQAQTYATRNT